MHWYDWHTVTERLQGRAYALTRGRPYKVVLDPNTPTGCCDFTLKKILINPNLFSDYFQKMGLSGSNLDKANFLVSRTVTGHEALHVLYSDPAAVAEAAKESAVLKTVLNLLEDARIEKIGSETSQVSKTLFRFVNGVAKRQLPGFKDKELSDPASIMHLLLRWRLGAHIPSLESSAAQRRNEILSLANTALHATCCAEVLNIAREIAKIAGLEEPRRQDQEVDELMGKMQSNLSGTRDTIPSVNPLASDESAGNSEPGKSGDNKTSGSDPDARYVKDTPEDLVDSDSSEPNIKKLVEETALQVSEDLDSLVPHCSDENPQVAKSTPYRGRVYSDVIAAPYARYLSDAAPIAAELIRDLKADGPRAVSGACAYPGRFKARYYIRDKETPFAAQSYQGLTVPKMALSLVIDRSGSMEHIVQELRTMSMAVTLACESLKIPLSIWALEGQVHIKKFSEHGPQVLAKIAGIHADTLTRVMPTMNDAAFELKQRPEELKQIVLIHDGTPSDGGDFIRWRQQLKGIGLFCLFIMKEEDYKFYRDCPHSLRERMDELVGPRNYAIAPVSELARHWCSHIRNLRSRHSVLTR